MQIILLSEDKKVNKDKKNKRQLLEVEDDVDVSTIERELKRKQNEEGRERIRHQRDDEREQRKIDKAALENAEAIAVAEALEGETTKPQAETRAENNGNKKNHGKKARNNKKLGRTVATTGGKNKNKRTANNNGNKKNKNKRTANNKDKKRAQKRNADGDNNTKQKEGKKYAEMEKNVQ